MADNKLQLQISFNPTKNLSATVHTIDVSLSDSVGQALLVAMKAFKITENSSEYCLFYGRISQWLDPNATLKSLHMEQKVTEFLDS